MATLFIISTPIGNLNDISQRALETLSGVDLILCEDTRVTKKLLDHFKIKKQALSYHQHSKIKKNDYIIDLLKQGKNLALVSDAGTPGVSDPGNKLIEELILAEIPLLKIVSVPGPSAVTAAASVSGFPMDKFLFLGFPPAKKKRKKFFQEIALSKYPVVFYESPYRIIKTLKELSLFVEPLMSLDSFRSEEFKAVVCREMTKKFETIYRGKIEEVIKKIEKDKVKGEFTIVISRDKIK